MLASQKENASCLCLLFSSLPSPMPSRPYCLFQISTLLTLPLWCFVIYIYLPFILSTYLPFILSIYLSFILYVNLLFLISIYLPFVRSIHVCSLPSFASLFISSLPSLPFNVFSPSSPPFLRPATPSPLPTRHHHLEHEGHQWARPEVPAKAIRTGLEGGHFD